MDAGMRLVGSQIPDLSSLEDGFAYKAHETIFVAGVPLTSAPDPD
jgi:hypothetical protein